MKEPFSIDNHREARQAWQVAICASVVFVMAAHAQLPAVRGCIIWLKFSECCDFSYNFCNNFVKSVYFAGSLGAELYSNLVEIKFRKIRNKCECLFY